ncbi:unnamed protein product, partial [Adineta steineri]
LLAGSWFISPALAGIISPEHLKVGLRWLPVFYSVTIMINVFSILLSAPPLLYFDRIPLWGKFVTTILVGLLIGFFVLFIVKPRMKVTIEESLRKKHDLDSRSGGGNEVSQLKKN